MLHDKLMGPLHSYIFMPHKRISGSQSNRKFWCNRWRHVALCVEPYLPPNSLAGLKSILKWFTQRMIEL